MIINQRTYFIKIRVIIFSPTHFSSAQGAWYNEMFRITNIFQKKPTVDLYIYSSSTNSKEYNVEQPYIVSILLDCHTLFILKSVIPYNGTHLHIYQKRIHIRFSRHPALPRHIRRCAIFCSITILTVKQLYST